MSLSKINQNNQLKWELTCIVWELGNFEQKTKTKTLHTTISNTTFFFFSSLSVPLSQALLCTSFVPIWSGLIPPELNGEVRWEDQRNPDLHYIVTETFDVLNERAKTSNEWLNERINEWMNEWMNESMNQWLKGWIWMRKTKQSSHNWKNNLV